jgi:hypothetical protein
MKKASSDKSSLLAFFVFPAALGAVFHFRPDFFPAFSPRERAITGNAGFHWQIGFGIFLLLVAFRHLS